MFDRRELLRRSALGMALATGCAGGVLRAAEPEAYELGSKRELFVDRAQVEKITGGARLELHAPQPAEIALKFDAAWDGEFSGYCTVLYDDKAPGKAKYRLYYRGWKPGADAKGSDTRQLACMAESVDGKTFTKPELGLFEFDGSKANNIVWDHPSHNFTPFIDTRPGVPADERYKALQTQRSTTGLGGGLAAYASADGIRWRQLGDKPVITKGAFDSQNLAFWDADHKEYRSYYRIFTAGVVDDKQWKPKGYRAVALATSKDFKTWTDPKQIDLGKTTPEHFYTNATTKYFRAPHYYFMFPKRFVPERSGLEGHRGISDGVFLSSRDGLHFDRTFMQAFIRPGRDSLNWGDRSLMTAYGLVQTGPDEMSVYYSENYRYPSHHVRRGVLRLDGIASLHADGEPGELLTKHFTFAGKKLELNFATSAAGSVRVEIQDEHNKPIAGYELKDAPEIYGDKLAGIYRWKSGDDVSALAGKSIRLRFAVQDADVYSYRFVD
ncbi:MAG: hypothetical protein JNL96_03800 [Planctomycetaceae bacterium]|nr:hypothetical protein [Planctomycetaceae bacterium]